MSMINMIGQGSNSGSIKSANSTDSLTLPRNTTMRLSAQNEDENEIMNLLLEVFVNENINIKDCPNDQAKEDRAKIKRELSDIRACLDRIETLCRSIMFPIRFPCYILTNFLIISLDKMFQMETATTDQHLLGRRE